MQQVNSKHSDSSPSVTGKKSKPGILEEFGSSLLYSAIQSPLDGVLELVDNVTGTKLLPKIQFISSPVAQKFGTANWYASEAGSSLGMLVPLLTVSYGVKGILGTSALVDEEQLASLSKVGSLGLSMKESALTGFAYGSIFEPTSNNKQNFFLNRLTDGLSSALTFSTMTAASLSLRSVSALSGSTSSDLTSFLSKALSNNTVNSILSGVPGGIVSAESSSLLNTGKLAQSKNLIQSAYTMGIIGGVFGGVNDLSGVLRAGKTANTASDNLNLSTNVLKPNFSDKLATMFKGYSQTGNLFSPVSNILIDKLVSSTDFLNSTSTNVLEPPGAFGLSTFLSTLNNPVFSDISSLNVGIDGRNLATGSTVHTSLGRNFDSNLNDLLVSRSHGIVSLENGKINYTDTSTNGTFIRRAGSNVFQKINTGSTVEIKPTDEIRLGSETGPKVNVLANKNLLIPEAYFNGNPLDLTKPQVSVGREYIASAGMSSDVLNLMVSSNHGILSYDYQNHQFVYTDTSSNGSFIKSAIGSWTKLEKNQSMVVTPADEIHLGSMLGPTINLTETSGKVLASGNLEFVRPDGRLVVKPDGLAYFYGKGQTGCLLNDKGQITDAYGPSNRRVVYDYNQAGKLTQVLAHNGSDNYIKYSSNDGEHWTVSQPDKNAPNGIKQQAWIGKISVGADGSTVLTTTSGLQLIRGLDGSVNIVYKNGYSEITQASLNVEQSRFTDMAKQTFSNNGQLDRFMNLEKTLIDKMHNQGFPQNDIALTLHQVNRLLSAGPEAMLPEATRARLAEQILFNAAYPKTIDQGFNNTCNVTTIEARLYEKSPQNAAKLIVDVALTGKYITPSGKVVDIGRTGGIEADSESNKVLVNSFAPNYYGDIKLDGSRNLANQIFQNAAVNIYYANHSPIALNAGDIVQYLKRKPQAGDPSDTGERLVLYSAKDGKLTVKGLAQSPKIPTVGLVDVYNQIVPDHTGPGNVIPGSENKFIVVGDKAAGAAMPGDLISEKIVYASNAPDFEKLLVSLKSENKLPIILWVDANKQESWFGPSRQGSGSHVILVQNIALKTINGIPTYMVDFTNQWGSAFNFTGNKAVPASELFKVVV